MNYWLIKSEPNTYSFAQMKEDKKTFWDGVRNYQARNFMKDMKKGDVALFYHSGGERQIIGEVKVVKEYYQDPSTDNDNWVAVDFKYSNTYKKPVELSEIKSRKTLSETHLVRNSRLSVMPLKKKEYEMIKKMSES